MKLKRSNEFHLKREKAMQIYFLRCKCVCGGVLLVAWKYSHLSISDISKHLRITTVTIIYIIKVKRKATVKMIGASEINSWPKDLHKCIYLFSEKGKKANCAASEKKDFVRYMATTQEEDIASLPFDNIVKRLLNQNDASQEVDRLKYLVFTHDQILNENYVFCSICILFSKRKSSLKDGCVVGGKPFYKLNKVILNHENSVAHLNAVEYYYGGDQAVPDSTAAVNPELAESGSLEEQELEVHVLAPATIETSAAAATSVIKTSVPSPNDRTETGTAPPCSEPPIDVPSSSIANSNELAPTAAPQYERKKKNAVRDAFIQRNRKIVMCVIECVLFLISQGNQESKIV